MNPTFRVSSGILDPKHRRQIGIAFWVYLWCVNRQTDARGHVLGASIIQRGRIARDLGVSKTSVLRQLHRLRRYRYLELLAVSMGFRIRVLGQKKFRDQTQALLDKARMMGHDLVAGAAKPCVYCGAVEDGRFVFLCEDHFIPVSAGGSDDPQNKVLSCMACNQLKGSRVFSDIEECRIWLQSIYSRRSSELTGTALHAGAEVATPGADLHRAGAEVATPSDLGSCSSSRSRSEKGQEQGPGVVRLSVATGRGLPDPVDPRSRPPIGFTPQASGQRTCSRCGRDGATSAPGRPLLCPACRELLHALMAEAGRGVPEVLA